MGNAGWLWKPLGRRDQADGSQRACTTVKLGGEAPSNLQTGRSHCDLGRPVKEPHFGFSPRPLRVSAGFGWVGFPCFVEPGALDPIAGRVRGLRSYIHVFTTTRGLGPASGERIARGLTMIFGFGAPSCAHPSVLLRTFSQDICPISVLSLPLGGATNSILKLVTPAFAKRSPRFCGSRWSRA